MTAATMMVVGGLGSGRMDGEDGFFMVDCEVFWEFNCDGAVSRYLPTLGMVLCLLLGRYGSNGRGWGGGRN